MRTDNRLDYDRALSKARYAAFPSGQFVGQESFMRAGEILALARAAGVGPGVRVLDLCCGAGGVGRFLATELGCCYRGVDASAGAVELARARTVGADCRFEVGRVPPVPSGPADVVLLLETLLAFADTQQVLSGVSRALVAGGRFAFTVEAGRPLTAGERAAMPQADTVWPVLWSQLRRQLAGVGLDVAWVEERTGSHAPVAAALAAELEADRPAIAAALGAAVIDDLLTAHRLWSRWLSSGRVRKLMVVATKTRRQQDPVDGSP